MNVVTKDATVSTVESENPHGEFDVILSTDDLDRDNEQLHADEWKLPLPEHITFDSDHGMSVATTVGSGKPFINDAGQLQVRGTFASTPHAQTVRTLVSEGHINKTSVAFSVHKTNKGAKPIRELLNGAFVAVPANEKAVVLSSKSVEALLKSAADGDVPSHDQLVQAVHDAAIHLGAQCMSDQEITDVDDGADDGANKGVTKSSGLAAGELQESPDSNPAEVATKAAAQAPAEVPTDAAALSADPVALRARSLAFLINVNTTEG